MAWYRKAADQGNAYAQYNVGYLYEHGQGVAANLAVALAWYLAAYRLIYRHALPLLAFEYAETPTLVAHFIFGLWLGRYPKWLGEPPRREAGQGDTQVIA